MECIFPRKPVYPIPEMPYGLDNPNCVYLGYDQTTKWDIWLADNKILLVLAHGIDESVRLDDVEIEKLNHRLQKWIAFAQKHGFLKDVFVLWECECGEAHMTSLEFNENAIVEGPE